MDANEAKVRAAWEQVHRCDGSYRDYPKGTILVQDKNGHWFDFDSWAAAAEFTASRQQQIAELDEEIAFQQKCWGEDYAWFNYEAIGRTIDRLQAARTELTRGMVTPQPKESQQ